MVLFGPPRYLCSMPPLICNVNLQLQTDRRKNLANVNDYIAEFGTCSKKRNQNKHLIMYKQIHCPTWNQQLHFGVTMTMIEQL